MYLGQIRTNIRGGCGTANRKWKGREGSQELRGQQRRRQRRLGPKPVFHKQEDQVRVGLEPDDVHQVEAPRQRHEAGRLPQVSEIAVVVGCCCCGFFSMNTSLNLIWSLC